jgi:hypothetical protein
MGPFSPTTWIAAAVLALFGLLAKHALDMKGKKNYREMFGSLTLSLLPATLFWLWEVSAEDSMATRTLLVIPAGALIGAFAFAWAAYVLHDMRKTSRVTESFTVPAETERLVSQAQFAIVAELEKFLGSKDENDLRVAFDLPAILQKNINTQIIRINLIKSGRENDFLYTNYTDNGSLIFWAKEGHYTTGPSGVHVDAGPKDVLFLVTTSKFQMAQKRLVEFANSALIPESIKKEVLAFNAAINQDTELMMRILDEKMHDNENYFSHNMELGTPYYGVIVSEFAARITPLKPAADKVLAAIAESWKISK